MDIRNRRALKEAADRSLAAAAYDPKKLNLIHSGARKCAAIFLQLREKQRLFCGSCPVSFLRHPIQYSHRAKEAKAYDGKGTDPGTQTSAEAGAAS